MLLMVSFASVKVARSRLFEISASTVTRNAHCDRNDFKLYTLHYVKCARVAVSLKIDVINVY